MSVIAIHAQAGFCVCDEFGEVMRFDSQEDAARQIREKCGHYMEMQFQYIDDFEQ